MYSAIVTSHSNPHLSGVARFNSVLARELGISSIAYEDAFREKGGEGPDAGDERPLLVSVKVRDVMGVESAPFAEFLQRLTSADVAFDLFFHTFDGLEMEYTLVENCRRVFCANAEILHSLEGRNRELIEAWCPHLLNTEVRIQERRLNLFSFGMAHKVQVRFYQGLWEELNKLDIDFSLWISTAFHEKARFGDFQKVKSKLSDIFGEQIQFLGFLSDAAVNYFMGKTSLFVAFFEKGVRANNTSVSAAMHKGCAVLTNCDNYSPEWMEHGRNLLDISRLTSADLNPERLGQIGQQGKLDADRSASWPSLIELVGGAAKL